MTAKLRVNKRQIDLAAVNSPLTVVPDKPKL